MTQAPVDAFGVPMEKCAFWSCSNFVRPSQGRRFCSRGCKQADSKRRSRKADRTREKRRNQGRSEGSESGHLYGIQAGSEPVVKVGYSKALGDRLRVFQTAHHLELTLVSSLPIERFSKNDPPDKRIHLELPEEDHIRGEWWWLTPEVQRVLESVGFDLSSLIREPVSPDGGGSPGGSSGTSGSTVTGTPTSTES
jgi:hypothetical protein